MAVRSTLLDSPLQVARGQASGRDRSSNRASALEETAKAQIYRQWRRGATVEALARQSGRSSGSIEKALNEIRARRLLEMDLAFIHDPSFEARDAERVILAPLPEHPLETPRGKVPAGTPPYLASLYSNAPLLSRERELHLFRAMNFLKYRASKLRETLDPARATRPRIEKIERLVEQASEIMNQIVRANLRLVVSIAKKRVGPTTNLFELVSDGNLSLMRAAAKFDYARGFKFSTYASWAIMKNFDRSIPREQCRRTRFLTSHDEFFESAADYRSSEHDFESDHSRNQETVSGMLDRLNPRERQILMGRYGLAGSDELTLGQLGKELGISKERVRQIETRACEKLRKFAQDQKPWGSPASSIPIQVGHSAR